METGRIKPYVGPAFAHETHFQSNPTYLLQPIS